jgi:hypothetical protein
MKLEFLSDCEIQALVLRLRFEMNPVLYKTIIRGFCCFLLSISFYAHSQDLLVDKLQLTETVPGDLLATRSVALYDPSYKRSELEEIQKTFSQIGIDTEAFIEKDVILAGNDFTRAYANYFVTREIKYLVILDKTSKGYRMVVTPFNNTPALIDANQIAWLVTNSNLHEMLMTAYRNSWISQKKQNFLVNDFPETDVNVTFITGRRSEFFAIDLKVDAMAVPAFGEAKADTILFHLFKEYYPFKWKLTSPGTPEEELRKKGFQYVLTEIQTRGIAAKQLLGYNMTKSESAYVSTTYPDGTAQLRAIPSETFIYKFYAKHIPSGNIFLGTKWDADTSWDQALKNYLKGFRAELKID